ncbi:MAG: LLM class flavin-dependent oxidoreductase, partial [Anaerolineales bacterium]
MKFGIWLPFSHAQWVAQMARLAEQSGWDGVFLREEVVGLDRWIPIAAAALGTQRILLGGLISLTSQDNVIPALKEAYRIHRRSGFRLVVCLGNRLKGELSAPDNSSLGRYPSSRVDELGDDDTP